MFAVLFLWFSKLTIECSTSKKLKQFKFQYSCWLLYGNSIFHTSQWQVLKVQQNSFNLMEWFRNQYNPALEESSPKTRRFAVCQLKSLINYTGRSQGNAQKGLQICPYSNCCGISWHLVSYSISFFSYEDPKSADEGYTRMTYFSD